VSTAFPLRPYQREAIRDIRLAFQERGINRPLIVVPTGGGKTVILSYLIDRRRGSGRALVIAHREELILQAADKIRQIVPGLNVGIVKAGRDEHTTNADGPVDIIVASIQTLASGRRLDPIVGTVATVVIDEAHHAAADTYLAVMRRLGSFDNPQLLTVGVTATAGRADGVGLKAAWQEIVYQRGILQMIGEGYLVDVKGYEIETDLDYTAVRSHGGDYTDASLGEAMADSTAIEAAALGYKTYAADRPGVAFTPTIALAEELALHLTKHGIVAEHVSGKTPADERRAILGRLHTGHTQVVTNAQVLVEGFDEPRVSCVLLARPTRSQTSFIQMAGRGLRLHPGKKDCLLLTMAGPPGAGLSTIADLAGTAPGQKPPKPEPGETLTEAVERVAAEQGRPGVRRLNAKQVKLFGRSTLRWLPIPEGFALPCGDSMLLLVGDALPDRWQVLENRKDQPLRRVIGNLTLEMAQGIGEERARAVGGKLAQNTADWRSRPPTPGQVRYLARIGRAPSVTSGEASDVIAVYEADRALNQYARAGAAA
jgi:superfamily II DNA or RNA helicase